MKKKTIPVPILVELIVLAVIVVLLIGVTVKKANNKNSAQNGISTEDVSATDTDNSSSESDTEPTASPDSSSSQSSSTSTWSGTYSYTPVQNSSDNSSQTVISFPYQDSTSGIVIGKIDSYDGSFLEDSSDEEVSGVAVIVVQNQGSGDIELAQITIKQGDTEYHFDVSALPQGAIAVVQEKDRKAYPGGSFNSCVVAATSAAALPMSTDSVSVEETEDGELKVTNLTGDTIPCVRLFYKYYSEEDGAFVGGITYTTKLTDLEAGQSMIVLPSHYVAGYSRVVMVRTYDTAVD